MAKYPKCLESKKRFEAAEKRSRSHAELLVHFALMDLARSLTPKEMAEVKDEKSGKTFRQTLLGIKDEVLKDLLDALRCKKVMFALAYAIEELSAIGDIRAAHWALSMGRLAIQEAPEGKRALPALKVLLALHQDRASSLYCRLWMAGERKKDTVTAQLLKLADEMDFSSPYVLSLDKKGGLARSTDKQAAGRLLSFMEINRPSGAVINRFVKLADDQKLLSPEERARLDNIKSGTTLGEAIPALAQAQV